MTISAPEAVGKAVVKEAIAPNPAKRSVDALAENMAKKRAEGQWREAMNISGRPVIDAAKHASRREQIGITRDVTTGQKDRSTNANEKDRYDRAERAAKLAEKFDREGYDKLSNVSGGEQEQMRNYFLEQAKQSPLLEAQLNNLTSAQKKDFAERFLKDPRFKGNLREVFHRLSEAPSIEGALENAHDAYKKAEAEKIKAEQGVIDVAGRLATVDAQLAAYKRDAVTGNPQGAMAHELDNLKKALPSIEGTIAQNQQAQQAAEQQVQLLGGELQKVRQTGPKNSAPLPGGGQAGPVRDENLIMREMANWQKEAGKAQQEVKAAEAQKQKITNLQTEQTNLETQRKELEAERQEKNLASATATIEYSKRQREWGDAARLRESHEVDLAQSYENAFGEAADLTLQDEIEQMDAQHTGELQKQIDETDDQGKKAMLEGAQKRWHNKKTKNIGGWMGVGRKQKDVQVIDKQTVDKDYNTLLTSGPEKVMRDILAAQINPDTNAPYNPVEIDSLMANNEYRTSMQSEVVKQLLAKSVLAGTIRNEEIEVIVTSTWGQGMMEEAYKVKGEFKQAVDKASGENVLPSNFLQEVKKHPWWLLLALGLGGTMFAVGAARQSSGELS